MSEHYDFHYQPTGSGAISGQQVLQQTEDAINELGDYVNDNMGGAMDVAQQALETAQTAETNAQTALDTANSFSSAIQSAQQDASTALSTAQTAQTTASNANNTAIQAQQDANTAVTTANNASGQVSTLSGTVTALGQRVTTAEGNIGQNTSDITALTTRVGTAEGNITTLQNDVTIAQGNASSAMATAGQVKQQAFVFRYSSTALVASSTNSNTLLDNTDNLKVGDKVIDSDGVLFSVTAIDTVNSTFTVGSALVDLAQDSDVVHKSGNETIGGSKTFSSDITLQGTTTPVIKTISNIIQDSTSGNESISWVIRDKTGSNTVFSQTLSKFSGRSVDWRLEATGILNGTSTTKGINLVVDPVNESYRFTSRGNNTLDLGSSGNRWKSVYAMNYYYGSNNVEFSTKFVTTDTNQTISGVKSFSDDTYIKNINFTKEVASTSSSTTSVLQLINTVTYTDQTADKVAILNFRVTADGAKAFYPNENNQYALGLTSRKWSEVHAITYYYGSSDTEFSDKFVTTDTAQTIAGNKTFSSINGVEPSSLSLPSGNASDVIDISSYLVNLDGTLNTYTAPTNGWISILVNNCSGIQAFINSLWGHQVVRPSAGAVRFLMPILKNLTANIAISGGTIGNARFIPCQGNV